MTRYVLALLCLSACADDPGGAADLSMPAAPTARQLAQAEAVETYANDLRDFTGQAQAVDAAGLIEEARRIVYQGDESTYVLSKAIRHVFKALHQGHTVVGAGPPDYSACLDRGSRVPLRGMSWYGVCGRAAGDASIITYAAAANPIGLRAGDRVVEVTRGAEIWRSPSFLQRVGEEPVCDGAVPNEAARADYAATNLFGILMAGDQLRVIAPDGTERTILAPERDPAAIRCFDPFQRAERLSALSTSQRADGVVVVYLPTLGDHPDHPLPSPFTLPAYRDWVAASIGRVNTALAKYTGITGIVWDIRGNGGGSQEYAIALMDAALLGPTEGALARCYARIPGSMPPTFATVVDYPMPYAVFLSPPLPGVAFAGHQVLLTDGLAVSASDWMALAARRAGHKIVGHASTGAYGYTSGSSYVARHIPAVAGVHDGIVSFISGARCLDGSTSLDLEGDAPVDTVVDFVPTDLANGIDTQLEEAARQARP